MKHHILSRLFLVILASLFCAQAFAAGKVYYENDFEKDMGEFRKWVIARRLDPTIHEFGLSDDFARSGKKSLKLSVTYKGGGYVYYKLPLSIRLEAGKTYYVSAWMHVKDYPKGKGVHRLQVGMGVNRVIHYGRNFEKDISGCRLFHYFNKPTKKWEYVQSKEVRQQVETACAVSGQPTDKIFLDNVYIGIQGGNNNSKVTVYIDDLKITSEPLRDDSIPVTHKSYPIHKKVFPYGHYSRLEGWERRFLNSKVPPFAASWGRIFDWKSCYANGFFSGVQIMADSDAQKLKNHKTEITIARDNNLYVLPNAYLSRYYKPKLTEKECEAAIRRIIPQYKDYDNILGWSLIDEPAVSRASIEEYLWAKKIFDEVDSKRPATTGAANFGGYMELYKAISVFDRYPLRENKDHYNPWQIADLTRMTARMANGPVYPILQSFGDSKQFQSNGEYVRPTVAEMRLMTFGALANGAHGIMYFNWSSRPYWTRVSNPAMTDPFGKSDGLLDEFRSMGKRLSAIGPLLVTTKLDEKPKVKVKCGKIQAAWEVMRDVIQVGIRQDENKPRTYLIPYSNDPKKDAKATLTVPAAMAKGKHLYDLEALHVLPGKRMADGLAVELSFKPGDGKFLLLATDVEFAAVKKEVLTHRFAAERETLKYRLYLAEISGLAKEDIVASFKRAANLADLRKINARLEALMKAPDFAAVKASLDNAQEHLSRLNRIIVENITPRESLLPKHIASRFTVREFSPKDPAVDAYLDRCLLYADWYFAMRNMYLMGKYKIIAANAKELDALTSALTAQAEKCFVKTKKVEKPILDAKKVVAITAAVAEYKDSYRGVYPNTKHLDAK
jgi:hypothetical protein